MVSMDRAVFRRCYAATVINGALNNNGYCIVVAAAQNLSTQFGAGNLMTAFTFILQVACISATAINGAFLVRFTPRTRVWLALGMLTLAYVLLASSTAFNSVIGFALALVASILAGSAQSIGEVTNLAFMKEFPPSLLGAWGAGTGISGLAGPGT